MVIIIDQALKKLQEMIKSSLYSRDNRSPVPKSEVVSRVMRANKAKNTGPEVQLRKRLREIGLSDYMLHAANIPGKPDIVFRKKKLAIFVNGCYWHRCPFCRLGLPKSHTVFWRKKFEANVIRDKRNILQLKRTGWRSIIVWECKIKKDINNPTIKIAKFYNA